ncbi:MAG TPA: hypothetical protein VGR57_05665 [Ktedonobacterales bacterium]|nr:hypothetical protein [Ktedonobacterales bacterium]
MRIVRWVEGICGGLATLAGLIAVAALLNGPAYAGQSCTLQSPGQPPVCVSTTRTLVEVNGATAIFDLTLVVVLVVGVGACAVWHARGGRRGARAALWAFAVLLLAFALLSGFTIGLFLLPSALLGLLAALFALGNRSVTAAA